MRPIPLTAPDGTIVTYACGGCLRQATHNEECPRRGPGYQQVERCCVCRVCREVEVPGGGPYARCAECAWVEATRDAWRQIGEAYFWERARQLGVVSRIVASRPRDADQDD